MEETVMLDNGLLSEWEAFLSHYLEAVSAPDHTTYVKLMEVRLEADKEMLEGMSASDPKAKLFMDDLLAGRLDRYSDEEFIDLFDPIVPIFGRYVHPSSKFALLGELSKRLDGATRVLDVGCGLNLFTLFLYKHGLFHAWALGLDPSPKMIKRARSIMEEEGFDADLRVGFGQDMPYESGSIDLVFALDSLHWTLQWRKVVKEMARVVAKNGNILIGFTMNEKFRSFPSAMEIVQILTEGGVDVDQITPISDNEGSVAKIVIGGVKREANPSAILVVSSTTY